MKRTTRNRTVQKKQSSLDDATALSQTEDKSAASNILFQSLNQENPENPSDTGLNKNVLNADLEKATALNSDINKGAVNQCLLNNNPLLAIDEIKLKYEEKIKSLSDNNRKLQSLNKKLNKELFEQREIEEIRKENEILILQLHRVQNELEKYYLENQKIKEQTLVKTNYVKKNLPKTAVERIKQETSYKLGALMIENSHNIRDIVKLPALLYKNYILLENSSENSDLPPLEQYPDASEVDKVKGHLSYRLGSAFVAHISSPFGIVKLPLALSREVILFRRKDK